MVIREGINSKKVNLKFTNGSLDTFGYTSTGKVSESIDALASLITKGTDALTDINSLKSLLPAKGSSNTVELYEIIFGADKTTLRLVTISKE
jgi:anaerobic glycerol-3-phosphate dehydrogenase